MLEAPLNAVPIIRLKSDQTNDPSLYFNDFGTTVHPNRTPVKPAYLLKELTSIATSLAPSHSKIDLGTPGDRINGAYAASNTNILPRSLQTLIVSSNCSFVATAPVGLLVYCNNKQTTNKGVKHKQTKIIGKICPYIKV